MPHFELCQFAVLYPPGLCFTKKAAGRDIWSSAPIFGVQMIRYSEH